MRALALLGLLTLACQKPRGEPEPAVPPSVASTPLAAPSATPTNSAGRWTEAGRLSMARGGFALLTRPDGVLLAIGGVENGGDSRPSAYVDVYRGGVWSRGPDLPTPRRSPSIVALKDGGALVAFGFDRMGVVSGAERLDAALGKWTALPAPLTGSDLGAAVLADGRVLVAGGHDKASECMADSAIFDPKKNAWTTSGKLPEPQVFGGLEASSAAPGKAFLLGGLCNNDYYPLRVFDAGAWSKGPPGPVERIGAQVTALRDGRILVSGGDPSQHAVDAEGVKRLALFDPKTMQWRKGPALEGPRTSHGVAQLPDGRVMLAGGEDKAFHELDSVELYDPSTDAVTRGAPLPRALMHPKLATLPDGRVLAVGGWINAPGRYVGEAWIWAP